jgi:FKBP-type peptidyl-prolyl cis-trans isomerase
MSKISLILLTAVVLFCSCEQSFKKGDKGLEYKLISRGSGPTVKPGEFMQMQICQFTNDGKKDTILNDTRNRSGAVIEPFDKNSVPPEYFNILAQMKKGDSLVIRMLVDSLFSKNMAQMPPFFKKGNYFTTTVSLVNIFKTREQADSAMTASMIEGRKKDSIESIATLSKDDKTIQDFLKKNNVKTTKTSSGVYVEILTQGVGPMIDTTVVVKTNYTGKTLNGKVFDSNTDPAKGNVEPLSVNMTSDMSLGTSVIKGWVDGLKLLNKGSKARFYIPSPLGYGKQQMGEDLLPNSILVFEVEILDLLNKTAAAAEMEKKKSEMKLKQKKYMDSVSKAQKAPVENKK